MARGQSVLSPLSSLSSPSSIFWWHRYTSLLGLLLLLLHLPVGLAAGQTVHTLYWNSTSPIFHSKDPLLVNMEGHKFTFDQAHIVCPSEGKTREAYRVYSVTRAEFYSCHLCEATSPRLLADCSAPGMVTISFRRFSPLPGGLEFSPGSTHYLLSIRDSASNQTECKRNLKLVLMVGAMVEEEEPRSLAASAMVSVNKPRRQLQRRLVEEEAVSERRKEESLLYQSLSMSRQSEEGQQPSVSDSSDSRILAKLVSSSSSCSKPCVSFVILLVIVFTPLWPSDKA